jgi:hypothetical protein
MVWDISVTNSRTGQIMATSAAIYSTQEVAANAYIERYNRSARYYWLSQYLLNAMHLFRIMQPGRYNIERLKMSLGGNIPKQRLGLAANGFYLKAQH